MRKVWTWRSGALAFYKRREYRERRRVGCKDAAVCEDLAGKMHSSIARQISAYELRCRRSISVWAQKCGVTKTMLACWLYPTLAQVCVGWCVFVFAVVCERLRGLEGGRIVR